MKKNTEKHSKRFHQVRALMDAIYPRADSSKKHARAPPLHEGRGWGGGVIWAGVLSCRGATNGSRSTQRSAKKRRCTTGKQKSKKSNKSLNHHPPDNPPKIYVAHQTHARESHDTSILPTSLIRVQLLLLLEFTIVRLPPKQLKTARWTPSLPVPHRRLPSRCPTPSTTAVLPTFDRGSSRARSWHMEGLPAETKRRCLQKGLLSPQPRALLI